MRQLKPLEVEAPSVRARRRANAKLHKVVTDLSLDKEMLQDALRRRL